MSTIKEKIKESLAQVAIKNNFVTWAYELEEFGDALNNYFGDIVPVKLTYTSENKNRNELHLIVKLTPEKHPMKGFEYIHLLYLREIKVYSDFIEIYKTLNTGVDLEDLCPKCFYASKKRDSEVLVLKDMRYDGFERYKRDMFMDYNHAEISIKAVAKFHALSLIAQQKGMTKFEENDIKEYVELYSLEFKEVIRAALENCSNIITDDKEIVDYCNKLSINLENHVNNSINNVLILVLGHGDLWKENILYKYADKKPTVACLIDYQATCAMSPAFDFLYFILTSVSEEMRKIHYETLKKVYYETISTVLKDNNLDLKNIYSKESFEKDIRTVIPICIVRGVLAFSNWLSIDGRVPINKAVLNEEDKQRNIMQFKQIIIDMFEHLAAFK